ncbi:Uncharacterized protein GBIM_01332 [Gryllus bimaculatus]|nr:Uncharacterized protein GBIM_01332 [Gryllus bimaculatus]
MSESLFLQSRGKDVFVLHRDIKFRELKTLIEFVYYGDLRFCDDTIEELMIAAEILQIRGLQGRSKACFQSTKKEVGEGECSTKYCKNVRFDSYQKNKKPSHHQITVTDGSVPKEGNEWSECYNECYPQGTDPNHVETLEVPQVPGVLTRQQGITAQILEMREGVTSDSENINWTAKENNKIISGEAYVDIHFSECSVILRDVWKDGILQRDKKGDLIVSGIKCDLHPLVSSSKKMQSAVHDKAACVSKVDVNMCIEEQDLNVSHTTCANLAQQTNISDQTNSNCRESGALPSNTTNHIKTRTTENELNCFECGKNFKCAFNLENHYWSHAVDRPFICEICGKSFSVKGNYKRHVYMHSNERPYVCQGCGKRFKVVTSLQLHYRQHCGRHS